MKTYLLPKNGNFYKSNLHCHTTVSDGRLTPEEIKEKYKAKGYSVVAYTDHDAFVTHNDLRDEEFLPLNGYEVPFREPSCVGRIRKKSHFCFISLDENRKDQKLLCICGRHHEKNKPNISFAPDCEEITDKYDVEYICDIIEKARNDGFFVTYNHPVWSLDSAEEYCGYHGMHAMEIINYGCVTEGYNDRNEQIYEQMLRGGEKIYCIATDDNHNAYPEGHPKCDSFGGFTVIKADKLEYSDIANALVRGNFYASEGPEIKELYIEDGKAHIVTSEAVKIVMSTEGRNYSVATPETVGDSITEATFNVNPSVTDYIRFSVFDKEGKCAYTNAYYLSELC